MKNATLSVLLLLALGVTWVGAAAAQTDEPEGDAPSEPSDSTESADEAPAEEAPAEDAAEAAEAPADGVAAEEAPVEAPADGTTPDAATADAATADVAVPEPVVEAEPEPEVALPPVEEEPVADLGSPDAEPVAEEAAEEAAEEEAAAPPEPAPWRNTFLNYTNQGSFNSLWRGGQLSYNPSYSMALTIVPRWYPGTGGFLRANMGLTLELTDTDGFIRNREPMLNDLLIDYVHPFMLGEGFILMTMARLAIPTSRLSQASQRYLQTAGQLTMIKIIPEAGNLTLAVLGRYGYWFAGSNVNLTDANLPCTTQPNLPQQLGASGIDAVFDPGSAPATCNQFGGPTTGRHVVLAGISATMTPIGAFSINLSAFMFNLYGHDLAPATVHVATSEEPHVFQDGSPSHWRNFTFFSISIAYQFLPWLNMSLGIQNSGIVAPVYDPSGNFYNPLFTPATQGFLTASIQLDQLYTELTGAGEDDLTPEERQRRRQGLASGPSAGGSF